VEYKFRCHILQPVDCKVINVKRWIYMCTEYNIKSLVVWLIKLKILGTLKFLGCGLLNSRYW